MFVKSLTLTAAAVAFAATPALALPPTATQNPGTSYQQASQPAGTPTQSANPGTGQEPAAGAPDQGRAPAERPTADNNPGTQRRAKAPGQYCKSASKKPVEGQKGTPYSQCVKAQAQLRKGATSSPREACKAASKKPAEGQKRSAFSVCVEAGAKLLGDQAKAAEQEQANEQATTES